MLAYLIFVAASGPTAASAAAQPAEVPPKQERTICKSSQFVGSHVSQRICKTETEWNEGRRKAREHLDNLHNRGVDAQALFPIGDGG